MLKVGSWIQYKPDHDLRKAKESIASSSLQIWAFFQAALSFWYKFPYFTKMDLYTFCNITASMRGTCAIPYKQANQ